MVWLTVAFAVNRRSHTAVRRAVATDHKLGRTIEPVAITFDEWVRRTHAPEGPFRDGMERMFADYDKFGFPGGNALVLRAILGREPRTLKDFFTEQANAKG